MSQELTDEKRKKLNKAGAKLLLKGLWNGMHNGLMAIVMNIILTLGLMILAQRNIIDQGSVGFLQLIGCVGIAIFVIKRMARINLQNVEDFKKSVQKILE